jgi:hypothetical protein
MISSLLSNCRYTNKDNKLDQESLIKTHLSSITNIPVESTESPIIIPNIISQIPTIIPRNINFEFIYKETPCGINPEWILDSKNNVLKYEPLGEKEYIIKYLELSVSELDTIYLKAAEIGFFRYPNVYKMDQGGNQCRITPGTTYELSIINGELSNKVIWEDITRYECQNDEKTIQLRELMNTIQNIINEHSIIMGLPTPKARCL